MPGIFISIFPGEAAGDAVGIGMFISIFCWGEACGWGEAVGICMPGMFICICLGAGCGGADFGDDEGLAGMFIPRMLPILPFIAGVFCAAVFFLRGARWRIFIPGILLISCLFAVCFFLLALPFFRIAVFALDFGFALLMPGIWDMFCP